MSGFKTVTGLVALLAFCGCGLYGTPQEKEKSSPVDAPWILDAPAHKNPATPQQSKEMPSVKAEMPPKMDQVFSVKNPDTIEARIERLEHEMAGIKLDLAQIAARYNLPSDVTPEPLVQERTVPKAKAVKKVSLGKTGVRFGLHSNKTRVVIDLPKAATFVTDLDNNERFLLIELQGSDLKLSGGAGLGLVSSYSIDTDTSGKTRVLLNLKDDAKIIAKEALRPSGQYGHRVFIDLARL